MGDKAELLEAVLKETVDLVLDPFGFFRYRYSFMGFGFLSFLVCGVAGKHPDRGGFRESEM